MLEPADLERHQIGFFAVAVVLGAAAGLGVPRTAVRFDPFIAPALIVLLYSTFLQVPLVRLRAALGAKRFLRALLAVNFLAVPVLVWGLLALVPAAPAVRLGVLLVLLTPCIDYVVVFTRMGGGDAARLLAATPILLLMQLGLLPAYLALLLGVDFAAAIDPAPFLEALFIYILLPLAGAALTERQATRRPAAARWARAMAWVPVPALAVTLFLVAASQVPRVAGNFDLIAGLVPVYAGYLLTAALLGTAAARAFRLDAPSGRALVFSAGTRNSLVILPLALAAPRHGALVAAVVVTQTLVELVGELVYIRVVPGWLVPSERKQPN
ncbi:MAG: arsenic resistance protein [Methylohalobius crimeensis]